MKVPKAALILRGGPRQAGAGVLRYDPFCSRGNVRLEHSFQRSHFLVKKPTELVSFGHLFPWKAMDRRGTERECGAVGTAFRGTADPSLQLASGAPGGSGFISLNFPVLRLLRAGVGSDNQRSHLINKISRLRDNVLVLHLQRRKHIVYDRTVSNHLVAKNSWSRDTSGFWPPELPFFFFFLDIQDFLFLQYFS